MGYSKKIVTQWYPDLSPKLAKNYDWGCSSCKKVYKRQTDAAVCCMDQKGNPPYWWKGQKPSREPIGTYRPIEDGLYEILPINS